MNPTNSQNTVKKSPRMSQLINRYPVSSAIISKLQNTQSSNSNNRNLNSTLTSLNNISSKTTEKITNNDDILTLFPDAEISIEIVTSSMTSPNDLVHDTWVFESPNIEILSSIKNLLTNEIKDYIETNYDILDELPTIVSEALFTKGAYIKAIIPEASLDDLINKPYDLSQEALYSFNKNSEARYLGNYEYKDIQFYKNDVISTAKKVYKNTKNHFVSLESYNVSSRQNIPTSIEFSKTNNSKGMSLSIPLPIITENYKIIKDKDLILETTSKNLFNGTLSQESMINGYESSSKKDIDNLLKKIFKTPSRGTSKTDFLMLPTHDEASRRSIGKPLTFKIPTEAVIPVHATGNPEKHIGYFVLIDENGMIVKASDDKVMQGNPVNPNDARYDGREYIEKARNNLYGMTSDVPILAENEEIYSSLVEKMILRRLRTGGFGELADIQESSDLYRVMFYRALQNLETRLVFLPSELVAYYAFEYRQNGTGRSLLEKVAPLFSIRGILLMTTVLAYLKNSINTTTVTIKTDDDDPLPETTIDIILNEIMKNRDRQFPLGMMRLYELQDWAVRLGYKVQVEGPNAPDIQITADDSSRNIKIPETELDEKFSELIYQSFGLTPEMVKQGADPEFATTITSRNLLFTRRIRKKQKILSNLLTKHVRKILACDGDLKDLIRKLITDNIDTILKSFSTLKETNETIKELFNSGKDYLIEYLIKTWQEEITVSLPEPRNNDAQAMINALKDEFDNVDTVIDAIFNDVLQTDIVGNIADQSKGMVAILKSELKKKVVLENNYLPDLGVLLSEQSTIDDTEITPFNNFSDTMKLLTDKFLVYYARQEGEKKQTDLLIEKIENGLNEEESTGDSGGNFGGSEPEPDSGGDTGGSEEDNFEEDNFDDF